jgi:hypothetical protein
MPIESIAAAMPLRSFLASTISNFVVSLARVQRHMIMLMEQFKIFDLIVSFVFVFMVYMVSVWDLSVMKFPDDTVQSDAKPVLFSAVVMSCKPVVFSVKLLGSFVDDIDSHGSSVGLIM